MQLKNIQTKLPMGSVFSDSVTRAHRGCFNYGSRGIRLYLKIATELGNNIHVVLALHVKCKRL